MKKLFACFGVLGFWGFGVLGCLVIFFGILEGNSWACHECKNRFNRWATHEGYCGDRSTPQEPDGDCGDCLKGYRSWKNAKKCIPNAEYDKLEQAEVAAALKKERFVNTNLDQMRTNFPTKKPAMGPHPVPKE